MWQVGLHSPGGKGVVYYIQHLDARGNQQQYIVRDAYSRHTRYMRRRTVLNFENSSADDFSNGANQNVDAEHANVLDAIHYHQHSRIDCL